MAYRQTAAVSAVTPVTGTVLGQISLGAPFGRILGFTAKNWASSAKAADGTGVASRVELKDARGLIFYLDAADKDYRAVLGAAQGAARVFTQDDTTTGLSVSPVDSTGAAAAAGEPVAFVAQSPVTVTARGTVTATDFLEVSLAVEI